MYIQPEDIMEKYDLNVNQISKGRGAYICDTSEGMKLLAPFRGSKERADFLRRFLAYMKENGFCVEQIILTAEGEPLAEDEMGIKYMVKDMFCGNECSTRNREEMREAVRLLARFHKLSASCPLEVPAFMMGEPDQIRLLFQKHQKELVKMKNYVRARKKKNAFEQQFQQQYPHYMECAKEAVALLCNCSGEEYLFCHGDFNQHNVLHSGTEWRIVHFEHLEQNPPMVDFANFLRKMLEKNAWKPELGLDLIECYDRVHKISRGDYLQLYAMLYFPEKFWKVANHYNGSHKAWLCERDLEKLEKVIAQEEQRERFLGIMRAESQKKGVFSLTNI